MINLQTSLLFQYSDQVMIQFKPIATKKNVTSDDATFMSQTEKGIKYKNPFIFHFLASDLGRLKMSVCYEQKQ